MCEKDTGRPRGFGFVLFSDPSVLDRVLEDKHVIDGRQVDVKRAISREEQQASSRSGNYNAGRSSGGPGNFRTKKIFVGGLPSTLTEDEFRQYYENYGQVTDVVIMFDQNTQRPRGFGFITFDNEDAVDRVLIKNFHELNGKLVEVKRALPRDANLGGGSRGGGYQHYGSSGANNNAFDGQMDGNRYMQPQTTLGGFPQYGYGTPGYGYGYGGPNSSVSYGGYGSYRVILIGQSFQTFLAYQKLCQCQADSCNSTHFDSTHFDSTHFDSSEALTRRSLVALTRIFRIRRLQWIVHRFTSTSMALFGASRSPLLLFQPRKYAWFLARFGGPRFPFRHSSSISFSFATLDDPVCSSDDGLVSGAVKHVSTVDERYVLDELRCLLPVSCNKSIPKLFLESCVEEQCATRTADGYLLPEEKLRGVFLQKLKGQTAIEHALASADVDLTLDVVAKVLNKGNLGGEAMVTFFKWAIKQPSIPEDTLSYNIVLKALGRRKFFNFMMDILRDMTSAGVTLNTESLSIVMDSFIRARRITKAFQMLGTLDEIGLKFNTQSLNILLQCMCQRSHVGAASQIFNSMKGKIPFNFLTYNIMIGGWSKYGKIGESQKFLKAMEDDGFCPDCSTYTYIIEGLGRAGLVDSAIKVFNEMAEKGCSIDTGAYNALLSNFIAMGDFDKCMIYYKKMLSSDCIPNNDTYTKLIIALMKTRKVADALEMFDEMLVRGVLPSTGSITSFIKLLCGFGPPYAALEIYKRARKAGCQISETSYKLLLMRLSRFGKCGMMLTIWDEMQECGYSVDVESYEYVINGLCNIGHLDNAVLVMEECLSRGFCPSRLICSKLNNKLLASEKVQVAYKLFLKIKDARRADHMQRCWRANGWHF